MLINFEENVQCVKYIGIQTSDLVSVVNFRNLTMSKEIAVRTELLNFCVLNVPVLGTCTCDWGGRSCHVCLFTDQKGKKSRGLLQIYFTVCLVLLDNAKH